MNNLGTLLPISLDGLTLNTTADGLVSTDGSIDSDLFAQMFSLLNNAQTPVPTTELPVDGGNILPVGDNNLPVLNATIEVEQGLLDVSETALLPDEQISGLSIELSADGIVQTPVLTGTEPAIDPLETKTPLNQITPVPVVPVTPQQVTPVTDAETPLSETASETVLNPALLNAMRTATSTRPDAGTAKPERPAQAGVQLQTAVTPGITPTANGTPAAADTVDIEATADLAQQGEAIDLAPLQSQSEGGDSESFQSRLNTASIGALQNSARVQTAEAPRAPVTQTMTYTPDSPEWGNEIADRVSIMMKHGPKEASIQMNPPELGRLNIQISTDGDKTTVVFHAQQAATREALEQAMPRLREFLNDTGLELAQGEVFDHAGSQQDQEFTDSREPGDAGIAGEHIADEPHQEQQVAHNVERLGLVDAYI